MTLEKLQARINRLVAERQAKGLPIDQDVFIRVQTPYFSRTRSKFYTFPFVESGITAPNGREAIATININLEKDEVK